MAYHDVLLSLDFDYDTIGNKNVSETVSLYGTIAAHYGYSSFGKVVLVTSENESQTTAALNPYQFSSEHYEGALGLVYYNYRHYNLKDGRWIGRDPKTDFSCTDDYFDSAYSFVLNNSVGMIDATGMDWVSGNPNWPPVLPPRTPKPVPSKPINPNWPPVIPSRPHRPMPSPGTRFARSQVADAIGTKVAFAVFDYAMGLCDGPCTKMGDCMACCKTTADIAMGIALAKYIADNIGCVRLGHPVLLVVCMASAAESYSTSIDRILQAQSDCLKGCWDNPL